MSESTFLQFEDEPDADVPQVAVALDDDVTHSPWRVLVTDDDQDVHETTEFALQGLHILGQPLELLHAYSAEECIQVLKNQKNIAVVLLDVVMETEDAGLKVVERIRNELGLHQLRIVLRTGQPGQTPEFETISQYDINDYKTKSELTRGKLFATLTTAMRSYDQLNRLELSRQGLEKIIQASTRFIADQGMQSFAEGVITQIAGLLGIAPEGVVCASAEHADAGSLQRHTVTVIAAAGNCRHWMDSTLDEIEDAHIVESLNQALKEQKTLVHRQSVTLYFAGNAGSNFAAHIAADIPLREVDRRLLEVFCTNISLCANNVALFNRLHELAYTDSLVKLPNRFAFLETLRNRMEAGALEGQVLVKLDIDQFAQANETLGHAYGDSLLQALVGRLNAQFGKTCALGRLGGNTFCILGPHRDVTAENVLGVFDAPFESANMTRRLSASIGLVRFDEAMPRSAEEFLEFALVGLKRAKSQGLGRAAWFTRELGNDAKERSSLLQGLHKAVDMSHLFLVFQPKVEVQSERVIGLEALLRWRDESGNMVSPDRFIPVAEQSGLIVAMGLWVLQSAIETLTQLSQAGFDDIQMGVNVSVVQLEHPEFMPEIKKILANSSIKAHQLELEITESIAILGVDRVVALLEAIGALGIGLAIDDFGTGFSSLSYIDRLPADRIKIDRSFIKKLDGDPRAARLARLIIPMGHQLGMKVVAEGVETATQLEALKEMGCDEVQGYYYGKPMLYNDLLLWLQERRQPQTQQQLPAN
jgi:diguanylate cyclase (GGDEF)-like protein